LPKFILGKVDSEYRNNIYSIVLELYSNLSICAIQNNSKEFIIYFLFYKDLKAYASGILTKSRRTFTEIYLVT